MTVVRKQDRILEHNAPGLKIYDYALPGIKIGISYQEGAGRIPAEGLTVNTVCEEYYYVLDGTGTITIDGKSFEVNPGDVAIVPPNAPASLTTNGIKYLTITNPDWYAAQNKIVETRNEA